MTRNKQTSVILQANWFYSPMEIVKNFKIKLNKSNFRENSSATDMDLLHYIQILKDATHPTITFKNRKISLKEFFHEFFLFF